MTCIVIATEDSLLWDQMSAQLSALDLEPLWAMDGHEALELTHAENAGVVFAEPNLKIFTGLELASELRDDPEIPAELPIYLLSDDDMDPHVLERHGLTGIFRKTHEASELRELVTRAVEAIPGTD